MNKSVRFLNFFIILLTFLMIAGCSKNNTQSVSVKSVEAVGAEDDGVYVSSINNINCDADDYPFYAFSRGDVIYLLINEYTEEAREAYLLGIDAITNEPTGEKVVLDSLTDSFMITNAVSSGDGFLYTVYDFSNGKTDELLVKCDKNGVVTAQTHLRDFVNTTESDGVYVGMLSDGVNTYIVAEGRLMLLDEDLNFKKDLAKCDSLSGFINDDGVAFFMKNYNGDIMSYDPRTDKVNDEFAKIPFLNYFYGTGYELFGASGSSLKSIDTNTGEIIKLFEFTDVNVSGESFQDVFRDGAGNIHLIYMKSGTTLSADGKEGYSTRYYNCDIKRYEKGEISEPEEIWIACNYMGSETEKAINEYNLAHPETKIRTKCYYDDYADFSQGIDAFDRDLLDNVNFDLVLLSMGFDSDKYTSKGLFEDLMPYIERDPSFDVKDYYENALFANKEGNKMFSLPVSIYLEGYEGDSTVFGDKETLSINDIIAARANYPDIPFISYGSNSNVLFYMLDSDYRLFLGTKEGTYDFNTDEFRKLLELAATFPTFTEDDYRTYDSETNIIDGKEKLTKVSYYGVLSYVENRARFGKNFKSYGTASLEGNGYYISPEESLAIMSTSTHKEEAWEIIKEVLNTSSDFSGYSFSIKRDTFKADLEASYKQVKLGFNISYEGGHTITLSMTEEDKVFLESLIDGAVAEKPLEGEVRAIISDEIKYFFNKEKSLDDTIKIISSRVNLFMKEKE